MVSTIYIYTQEVFSSDCMRYTIKRSDILKIPMDTKKAGIIVVVIGIILIGYFIWSGSANAPIESDDPEKIKMEKATVPLPKPAPPPASGGTAITPNASSKSESGVVTVRYTNAGFVPFLTEIRQGQAVRFVNESSKALHVASHTNPPSTTEFIPGFEQGSSIGRGESFTYVFGHQGVWGYLNKNFPDHKGAIVALPQ